MPGLKRSRQEVMQLFIFLGAGASLTLNHSVCFNCPWPFRFEMPYNIWCDGCKNHIGMGKCGEKRMAHVIRVSLSQCLLISITLMLCLHRGPLQCWEEESGELLHHANLQVNTAWADPLWQTDSRFQQSELHLYLHHQVQDEVPPVCQLHWDADRSSDLWLCDSERGSQERGALGHGRKWTDPHHR